jgi:myo-inositol-1(or 4)-monophosphatase
MEAEMTDIDGAACAALVREIADEFAARGAKSGPNATIADMIAHVRGVSEAAGIRMRAALAGLYPAIGWTNEEGRPGDDDYWLYDPIDGAYHWLQGLPLWASSLVLVRGGRPVFSIVYHPSMKEMFVAVEGGGATCNDVPIRVSLKSNQAAAVVGTAVPPLGQVGEAEQDEALGLLRTVARSVFVVRPMAAASLQLAYVAAGRLDAYFENGRDAADWLAGTLLIREADGVVTDLAGDAFGWSGDGMLSASAALHPAMLATIGRVRRTETRSA